jgi:AraC-like DNA-binding protein
MDTKTRPEQILADYTTLIDRHLDDLVSNRADRMLEIEDFAEHLHIHPTHLSNTIKEIAGQSACGVYQYKILQTAEKLLSNKLLSVKQIALLLTFEPSQFTKWFKRFSGQTPREWRKKLKS